eukprot:gene12512-14472_t
MSEGTFRGGKMWDGVKVAKDGRVMKRWVEGKLEKVIPPPVVVVSPVPQPTVASTSVLPAAAPTPTGLDGSVLKAKLRNNKMRNGVTAVSHGHVMNVEKGVVAPPAPAFTPGEFAYGRLHNAQGTYVMKDGTMYEGTWVDGVFDGVGQVTRADGHVQAGEYRSGRIHTGYGSFVTPDGAVYTGAIQNAERTGEGKVAYPEGKTLEGEFHQGRLYEGTATMIGKANKRLQVDTIEGKFEGRLRSAGKLGEEFGKPLPYTDRFGVTYSEGGSEREGTAYNSIVNSSNSTASTEKEVLLPDGSIYVGGFQDGVPHGRGKLLHTSGFVSSGEFYRGALHNGVRYKFMPTKDVFEEKYANGVKEEATLTLFNGDVLVGGWIHTEKNRLVGGFHNGLIGNIGNRNFPKLTLRHKHVATEDTANGETTKLTIADFRYRDGNTFRGWWLVGKERRQGVLTYPDGKTLTGEFHGSRLINGEGHIRREDGGFYEGGVKNGLKHGKGRLVSQYEALEGEFQNNKIFNGEGALTTREGIKYE